VSCSLQDMLRSLDQRAQRIKDVRNALLEGAM